MATAASVLLLMQITKSPALTGAYGRGDDPDPWERVLVIAAIVAALGAALILYELTIGALHG